MLLKKQGFGERCRVSWAKLLLLLLAALVAGAGTAAAETATPATAKDPALDAMKPCATGPDPEARAVACTTLITGGTLKGKALGAAYVFRGKAQAQRNEIKAAIMDFSEALKVDPGA